MNYKRLNPAIIHLETVDSTNNYAANLLKTSKITNGTVIVTKGQTAGKGQRGNSWESEDEKNIILSIILFPEIQPKDSFYLTIAASLAVHKTISLHLNNVKIKWPNDILVGQKKIAGILIENQIKSSLITSSIIGIGINVNQENFNSGIQATSFKSELNQDFNLENLLNELYLNLDFYINLLMENNFKILLARYYENLYKFKVPAKFEIGAEQFTGLIQGVDATGKLIVRRDQISANYDLKEIKFVF